MNTDSFAVMAAALACTQGALAFQPPIATVPDRTLVSRFLIEAESAMRQVDRNGDCGTSDIDLALAIKRRLEDEFGLGVVAMRDLDGDGVVNREDSVAAIGLIIKSTLGKTGHEPGSLAVSTVDVAAIVADVAANRPRADVNFDERVDALDVVAVLDRVGQTVSDFDVVQAARSLYEYVEVMVQDGEGRFMVSACAPRNHLAGISDTWPADHPSWWPPNHQGAMSSSWQNPRNQPPHISGTSRQPPPPHNATYSSAWPANHLQDASNNWIYPTHSHDSSILNPVPPNFNHAAATSEKWPPGHYSGKSASWPTEHAIDVSRTWWANHSAADSSASVVPPLHDSRISGAWGPHSTGTSQNRWPPNHYAPVSSSWGPGGHHIGVSSGFPPAHHGYVSATWPGPQSLWPSNHVADVSRTWSQPAPNPWPSMPLLPPDHSYVTTFGTFIQPIRPRWPWPS